MCDHLSHLFKCLLRAARKQATIVAELRVRSRSKERNLWIHSVSQMSAWIYFRYLTSTSTKEARGFSVRCEGKGLNPFILTRLLYESSNSNRNIFLLFHLLHTHYVFPGKRNLGLALADLLCSNSFAVFIPAWAHSIKRKINLLRHSMF